MWDAGNVSCKVGILTHPIVQEDIESIFKVYPGEAIMRRKFNPNRRIRDSVDSEMRERLNQRVVYGGNPEHKRNPGDFGLSPTAAPRPDKTLCDAVSIFSRGEAERLLKSGIVKGLVSEQVRGDYPQNVWAVTDAGDPLEAQLENQNLGIYHGYPMSETDPFREIVLERWRKS
jgi:hypothetical protein